LFPFATPRPKTYIQDILVLLSEQPKPHSPHVFVSAIEANLYHVPSSSSAILYVSKVDSTGQAASPSPTSALVRALLTYYLDPTTRPLPVAHVWVHLFARAQNQYLFPNSAEHPGKHPLSDLQLCAWWKRQLSRVADHLVAADALHVRLFYLLPGLGELEASHAMDRVSHQPSTAASSSSSVPWSYGHPYDQTDVPLPCVPIGRTDKAPPHIGHVVPWFDDDPKARFLDEIAYTTDAEGIKSPERKRPRSSRVTTTTNKAERDPVESGETSSSSSAASEQTGKALRKVSIDEFWERMSFRQECIAGAVTGFFVMATSLPTPAPPSRSEVSPLAPLPGQVSSQMMKRVLTSLMTGHEFPSVERAVWSTRVLEEAIKGLCDGLRIVQSREKERAQSPDDSHRRTPEPNEAARTTLAPCETPPPRLSWKEKRTLVDVSPNPFPEPEASVETYNSYIYGTVTVSNPEEPRKEAVRDGGGDGKPAITVLTARRKKRGKP